MRATVKREPPKEATTSQARSGAERSPAMRWTSVGKKVTTPTMTVTPSKPRPKTSEISGAIATTGIERSTIAAGMIACSTAGRMAMTAATIAATRVPAR